MITLERHGQIALITMAGTNDLNLDVLGPELYDVLDGYLADTDLRCAVITGAGTRAFTAGGDIKIVGETGDFGWNFWAPPPANFMTGKPFRKPLIAAVNGYALGAGLMLAMGCDIRIASTNASFGIPEVKYGFAPGNAACLRLPRLIAMGPAMEMILTGDRISADQAERWGLVNRVVAPEDLIETAMELAGRIAANAPRAVEVSKELALRSGELTFDQAVRLEDSLTHICRGTQDAFEGTRAYFEKRSPAFIGK